MAAAGADVTAVDLTLHAVEATRTRLSLRGLRAEIIQADAESLPLDSRSFDFVWSWGVIHHSARTAKIVREISRVVKASGECRVMVYNRLGTSAWVALVHDHLLKGGFLHSSFDETLYASTDGFSARYYTPDQFEDLFRAFFQDVATLVCGQDADAVPLPGRIRAAALKLVPESYLVAAQAKRGSFLFLTAREPW
jgi:ubiquinone/menaquinone biosynthesis C-methylase UbiE